MSAAEFPGGGPPWVSILIALIGAGALIYTSVRAKKGEKRGQDWQRIEGLWARVDALEEDVDGLKAQNTDQGEKIARLERWKAAALRYVEVLLAALQAHDITPPEPPPDYTEH